MRKIIGKYVLNWKRRGYKYDIPDECPVELEAINKVASYRMICRAILRNDVSLSSLGFSREKVSAYMALKKIEMLS